MAGSTASSFDAEVIGPLRRIAHRLKLRILLEGLGLTVLIFLAVAAVQLILDLLLVLGLGPRIALLSIVCGILAYQLWHRLIRPAAIRINAEDIAAIMERHDPSLGDALVSAVAFSRASQPGFDSQAMINSLISDVQGRFRTLRLDSLLKVRRSVRTPLLSAALLVAVIVSVTGRSGLLSAYVSRDWLLRDTPWPSRTHIVVEGLTGNKITWPLGDDFTLVAIAQGERPPSLRAEVKLDRSSASAAIREMPRRGEDQFMLEYGPLTGSMKVRFLIGRFGVDEPTQWYDVEAVERPHVESAIVTVSPPAYAELPKMTLPPSQTTVEALRGSAISIVATLNKVVTSTSLRGSGDQRLPAAIASAESKQVRAEFTPTVSGSYYFELVDAGGLTDLHPLPITIRLMNDPPPKVKLSLPGAGELIVAGAVLDLDIDCEDNVALRTVELRYQLLHESPGATSQPDSFTEVVPGFEPRSPRFATRHSWPLSGLGLKTGDQLTLLIRATDYQPVASTADGKSPGISDSIAYTLRVVSPEELLAELGRRESEWRREFELIVKSQADLKKRVLDLHDQAAKGFSTEIAAQYSREEAAQRAQVGRIKTIRRQFEQILAELKTNQLDQPGVRKRLDGGVIQPLGRLAARDCNQVADKMAELRRHYEKKSAQAVEQSQTALLEDMNAILAAMLKWEGYNEAVSLLRDVIRLQTDLNRQTQGRVEEQAEGLFGEPSSRPSEKK